MSAALSFCAAAALVAAYTGPDSQAVAPPVQVQQQVPAAQPAPGAARPATDGPRQHTVLLPTAPVTQSGIPELPKSPDVLLPIEQNIIQKTNFERAQRGLPPLATDSELMQSARDHAAWMTRSGRFQHTRRAVGENIAMGQSSSTEAVRDWMHSSGHRANILNRGYTRIGVGVFRTPGGRLYWVQQFLR